jgi:hypothetical protein
MNSPDRPAGGSKSKRVARSLWPPSPLQYIRVELWELLLIVAASLVVAVVCFGVLSSQSTVAFREYSAQGAIAGFVVSASLLYRMFSGLTASTRDVIELQRENQRLVRELLKSVPKPPDYEIEVDDRHRIVLVRPTGWEASGGAIFEYSEPIPRDRTKLSAEAQADVDIVPARVVVSYEPVSGDDDTQQVYERISASLSSDNPAIEDPRIETIEMGGEQGPVSALRITAKAFIQATLAADPVTGELSYSWRYVPRTEFEAQVQLTTREVLLPLTLVGGLGDRAKNAELVAAEGALVAKELEAGRLQNYAAVRKWLTDRHPDIADSRHQAPNMTGSTVASATVQAASTTQPATSEGSERTRIETLPVTRILVFCHHAPLRSMLLVDCSDNVADFRKSSEIFNKMIGSLRFLT